MKKILISMVVLFGLSVLGWQIYQKASASRTGYKRQRKMVPVAVEIAPLRKATIREVGRFTGSLYPFSQFTVAPKVGGRLEKILVDIGDVVKNGQLIAVLDDDEYRQQVYQAEAEVEVARANLQESRDILENTEREYRRIVALSKKKITSESELDAIEAKYKTQQSKLKVARAQLAQKEAALKMARVRLSYTQIRVPENNANNPRVVGERFVDEGAMLAPNHPIVSILDIETLTAVIYVIERDYPKIQLGLKARAVTDAFPGRTFTGRVTRIAPLLREKSREARVEIEIPNKQKLLKPGMFVRVEIEFRQHDDATLIPTEAIVKRNGTPGVFVADLKQKRARFVPVQLGIINAKDAEVLRPPLSGFVVTLGHHLLEDGAWIILPGEKPEASLKGKHSKPLRKKKNPSIVRRKI
ncbi:MAG: efflux RND transporter periplasmic adaptor subunit [Deltaproteobacteria bacterium]|nr:efflux RND transporter periplasmic adaptor subunit [Deltaproteobacteria bacterium]MBW1993963.1 efflux RND transporter periplasmic adaptor subunit [Deltaproteobacteria bacterium]MBW2152360.1 efflux RND transporter periplasmic adaptor subunit [Deltaproteobacteria bacterium]